MALSELMEALQAQAAERRAEELVRADAEAERIRSEFRETSTRQKARHVERAIRRAEETARRQLSEARAEATASVLVARDRLLERVRAVLEARARDSITDPNWAAALADELAAALERLPPGDVVVRTRPELAASLAHVVEGRAGARLDPADDVGTGFVALSPAGGVEIDGTLEAKLRHRWPEISVEVLAEAAR